jgi:3-hydroxy acid dehydrogenase/malonic semialdehyde reductase
MTNRLKDKKVLVTGASAGFGEAIARAFAAQGAHLELWARRLDRLEQLKSTLQKAHAVEIGIQKVDVREREQVRTAAASLARRDWQVDVLINNAGLAAGFNPVHEGKLEDWDAMIDTNLKGLLFVTREILPTMVARDSGHVINIGSVAGYWIYPKGNVYNATKFAVRALTEAMSVDMFGTRVRVSSVDPGAADTEFSRVRFHGDDERAKKVYEGYQPLSAEDVADAVIYVANTPPHVMVTKLALTPTAQRSPTLIDRKGV